MARVTLRVNSSGHKKALAVCRLASVHTESHGFSRSGRPKLVLNLRTTSLV